MLYCKFCNKECKNANSLRNHERLCKENSNRDIKSLTQMSKNRYKWNTSGNYTPWNKGLTKAIDKRLEKQGKTFSENFKAGLISCSHPQTEESKRKIRESTLRYIKSTSGGPRYNKNACIYFDKLNSDNGWNLQHALNGGEIRIGRYSLDSYDSIRNIVVEYDERHHHIINGEKSKRDIDRENRIKEKLGCIFYRYDSETSILKEV